MSSIVISSAGTSGQRGFSWLSGAGAPVANQAGSIDGDFYLDTTNVGFYYGPRTNGLWGTPHPFGNSLNGVPLGNFVATTDPGVGNDNTQGYSVGSMWVNTATSRVSVATSVATGAAIWSTFANFKLLTVSSNYTILVTDRTIYANAAAGPINLTLPSSIGSVGRFDVKKIDTTNNPVTMIPQPGKLIDGASTYVIASPYQASQFSPDGIGGGNWYVL